MTTTVGRARDGNTIRRAYRWMVMLEGITLALAAPFLFIPEAFPIATAAALMALALVWLVSLVASPPPATPFNITILLWGIVLIVGILATADPSETLPKATGLILGLAVWRYVIIAGRNRRRIGLAVALLLLLCMGFSIVGVMSLQELPKIPLVAAFNPFRARSLPGLEGLAIHPNQLAGLICLYLPLLISLLVAPPNGLPSRRLRLVLGPATLLTVTILILTQSRGGWIGVTTGLFVLLALWAIILPRSGGQRALRLLTVAGVLAVLIALTWIGPNRIWDLWLNPPAETVVGTLTTLNFRRELWPWAIMAVEDFPLTGVGLGAFRQVAFRLYPLPMTPELDIGHAHNIFLQTALDVGLPGLVVYLAILFVAAATGWRVARRQAEYRSISLGLLAGLAALHVFGLADAMALGQKPGIVFWFALGLLAAMNQQNVRTSASPLDEKQ